MLHRAAWLRLLVTALLCVVGVARPVASMSEAEAAKRSSGPIQVSASTREGELAALRKRIANGPGDDATSVVEVRPECVADDRGRIGVAASHDARPSSLVAERPHARGPPIG